MREFVESMMADQELTQTAFAKRVGISQSTVNNILSGSTNVRDDIKLKIAVAFGLPPQSFSFDVPQSSILSEDTLTAREKRLLTAYRSLDPKRQDRQLEAIEDLAGFIRDESGDVKPGKPNHNHNHNHRTVKHSRHS